MARDVASGVGGVEEERGGTIDEEPVQRQVSGLSGVKAAVAALVLGVLDRAPCVSHGLSRPVHF